MLDLEALRASTLNEAPFRFAVVPKFVGADNAALIRSEFPIINAPGLFPLSALSYGPRFSELMRELNSPKTAGAFSEKFGVDLSGYPLMITVRGRCARKDGRIHTDSRTKVLSALLYFNGDWPNTGGRLRMLKSDNIEDYATEVPPDDGTLIAFVRSDHSYHGHLPYSGVRYCVQFNWMTDAYSTEKELARHRWSARTKQISHAMRAVFPIVHD